MTLTCKEAFSRGFQSLRIRLRLNVWEVLAASDASHTVYQPKPPLSWMRKLKSSRGRTDKGPVAYIRVAPTQIWISIDLISCIREDEVEPLTLAGRVFPLASKEKSMKSHFALCVRTFQLASFFFGRWIRERATLGWCISTLADTGIIFTYSNTIIGMSCLLTLHDTAVSIIYVTLMEVTHYHHRQLAHTRRRADDLKCAVCSHGWANQLRNRAVKYRPPPWAMAMMMMAHRWGGRTDATF